MRQKIKEYQLYDYSIDSRRRCISSVKLTHFTLTHLYTKTGFTLVEILVALAVFALVMAAAGETYISVRQAWQRQRQIIDLVQNSRWAMEFMENEVRHTTATGNPGWARLNVFAGGNAIDFSIDSDGDNNADTQIQYERNGTILQRRQRRRRPPPPGPWGTWQELANFIVDNPSGNDIFNFTGGVLTIELTLRPNPAQPAGPGNLDYTIRTQVRPRN